MKRNITGLALAIALFGAGQAQALLIDSYSSNNALPTCNALVPPGQNGQCVASPPFPGQSDANVNTGLTEVVGGSRDMIIHRVTGPGTTVATASANHASDPGALNYNNPAAVTSYFITTWDGDAISGNFGSSLGGVPLATTAAGTDEYLIWHVTDLDLNLLVTVLLKDADGTVAGNAFLKVPYTGGPAPAACDPGAGGNPIVCVQPSLPGNLYHGLDLFNTGGIDPATGKSFFDNPYAESPYTSTTLTMSGAADTFLAPSGGVGGLDLAHITAIRVIFDTSGNTGSGSIDVRETCLSTGPLQGTLVTPGQPVGAGNNIGVEDAACTVIPEPGTVLLMGTGLLGLGLAGVRARFNRRRQQA